MIYLGADHAGWALKESIKKYLSGQKVDYHDLGAAHEDPADDYPDFAKLVAQKVAVSPEHRGILICGSGQGICIAANKLACVRAGQAWSTELARVGRNDDDINVLCLAGRYTDEKTAVEIVKVFLRTKFEDIERRVRRIKKISQLEN